MENIKIDFNKACGKVKPMHAVNNGPVYKFASDQRITNIDAFRDAGIPYARTHDAAHDMELTQTLSATEELKLTLPLFTTVWVKIS